MSSYMSPNGHLHTSPMTLSQCFLRRSPASTSSYGDTPAPRSVNYQSPLVSETVDDVGYPAFASPTRPLVESRSLEPPWSPTDIQKILDGNWDNDSFLEGLFAGIANESYSEVDFGPLAHGLGTSEVPSDSGLDDSWSVNDTGGELRPVRDSPSPAPPAATCGAQCREGTWARPNALDALALTPHSNDAHASASHDASFRPAPASLSPAQVEHSPHKPCNSPMTPSSLFSHSPSAATSRVCSPDKARTPGKRALVFVEEYREEGMKGSRTVVDLDLYQPITATGMSPESSQAGESDLTGAEARPTATKSPVTTQPDEKSKISKDESQDESQ
ncbi:hypothetical protein C8Q79DRAFT_1011036 [Trametes meyenii]|nr:hypothetical protein C8Q79DRAFT_1011036 [Trametes meyenii]